MQTNHGIGLKPNKSNGLIILHKYCTKNGGPRPVLHEPREQIPYLSVFITHFISRPTANTAFLRKLYLEFKLSALQIEELTNFYWDKSAIITALRKVNIKRNRLSSRIKFGEKLVRGQRVPYLAEQKIIQQIISLRESKMSLRAVADYLNKKNTPTKLGSKWNKTTVGDILKRHLKRKV